MIWMIDKKKNKYSPNPNPNRKRALATTHLRWNEAVWNVMSNHAMGVYRIPCDFTIKMERSYQGDSGNSKDRFLDIRNAVHSLYPVHPVGLVNSIEECFTP